MAQKTSKSNEAYFARYKAGNLYAAHRKAKLERTAKAQPNNKQIPTAIKAVANYRRATPKVATWSHTAIATAKLYKRFVGKFDRNMFSQKLEDSEAARRVRNDNLFPKVTAPKTRRWASKKLSDFSIGLRAHDKQGNLVWV